jgi:hypothetical protein
MHSCKLGRLNWVIVISLNVGTEERIEKLRDVSLRASLLYMCIYEKNKTKMRSIFQRHANISYLSHPDYIVPQIAAM